MIIADILKAVKFAVQPNGQQYAAMVDMDVWEQIITLLEDAEDVEEMKQAQSVKVETIPWKTAKKELGLGE